MSYDWMLVSFLILRCFQKVEFHLNESGNDENETEIKRDNYDWVS